MLLPFQIPLPSAHKYDFDLLSLLLLALLNTDAFVILFIKEYNSHIN